MEDPEDKLDIFNALVIECIDRHAPLKRIKCTRPPVLIFSNLNLKVIVKFSISINSYH